MVYLSLCMLLTACEKEIQFKGGITEPLLVVNGFARPDSLLEFRLTASRFFLEEADSFVCVQDAHIRLYVDGSYREDLQARQEGYYVSSYRPNPGEVLAIEAEAPGFESVRAETRLPLRAELLKVDTSMTKVEEYYALDYTYDVINQDYIIDTIGVYNKYDVSMQLKFKDPLASDDYYRVVVQYADSEDAYYMYDFQIDHFYTTEVGDLLGLSETQNDYYIYSDELFKGKVVDMKLSFSTYSFNDYRLGSVSSNSAVQIQLQNISPSYYLYLKTLSAYQNAMDFFTEPIQIYSNVRRGIGLFGAYSSHIIELEFE